MTFEYESRLLTSNPPIDLYRPMVVKFYQLKNMRTLRLWTMREKKHCLERMSHCSPGVDRSN